MLLNQRMGSSGDFFFRWRSYAVLLFVPLLVLTFPQGEQVEELIGEFAGDAFELLCVAMVFGGLALRAFTVGFVPQGTSGRNTGGQVAQVLNTTGMYSLTRNPLYVGNCLTYLGIVLFSQNLLLGLAFGLFLVIFYERIILAEEAFLVDRFGDAYQEWAEAVPAFLPRRSGWRRPELPFSVRSVLRREYPGWFAAVLGLVIIEVSRDFLVKEHEGLIDAWWLAAGIVAAVVYLTLRTLKKRTTLLDVPGR